MFKVDASDEERVLHTFGGGVDDGDEPEGGLIMDASGNLYGTTVGGGEVSVCTKGSPTGCGTVFKITPQ